MDISGSLMGSAGGVTGVGGRGRVTRGAGGLMAGAGLGAGGIISRGGTGGGGVTRVISRGMGSSTDRVCHSFPKVTSATPWTITVTSMPASIRRDCAASIGRDRAAYIRALPPLPRQDDVLVL